MKRKKAIVSMFLLGGGLVATFSGYKFYHISKTPDLLFLDEHKELVAALAEIIIPRTNTPGAKDVKAEDSIINLLKNVSHKKTQNNFIDGLKATERFSMNRYAKNFTALTLGEQKIVVEHFYEAGKNFKGNLGKAKNKFLGKSFFDILKYYTTIAYCTSNQGATQALAYDYIPGRYQGCISLSRNQRSWATK